MIRLTRALAPRRAQRAVDDGFTLAELLVAMLITSIVLGGLGAIYTATARTSSITQTRLAQTDDARNGVETATRVLRTAVMPKQLQDLSSADAAFLSADRDSVSFYADIDNPNNTIGPSRVKLWVDASGNFWELRQPPDQPPSVTYDYAYSNCTPNTAGCKAIQRLVAPGVQDTAAAPIFKYYTSAGTQITSIPITGSGLADIDSVEITLTVSHTNAFSPVAATTYVERVALPNHAEIVREQASASP